MSARESKAVITTAVSAGWGRLRNSPGMKTIMRMIRAAPVTPVSWVLSPDRSATVVRDPLVLTSLIPVEDLLLALASALERTLGDVHSGRPGHG
jgi:hypothetical protein